MLGREKGASTLVSAHGTGYALEHSTDSRASLGLQRIFCFMNLGEETQKVKIDLSICEKEPIHIPGAIQPHGFLVGFTNTGILSRISQNLLDAFHTIAHEALGRSVEDVPSEMQQLLGQCFDLKDPQGRAEVLVGGQGMLARRISANNEILVELEHDLATSDRAGERTFQSSIQKLSRLSLIQDICDHLAASVRELLGYERVMIYRFDSEYNGTVIAERKSDAVSPFLGLRFPASDIPAQARQIFFSNRSRMIVDREYVPSPIVSSPNLGPLDLTYSQLRSVSPIHLEYLRNMGVYATLTLSIIVRGQLWGLVACHQSKEPIYVRPSDRERAEVLASLSSIVISSIEETLEGRIEFVQSEILTKVFSLLTVGEPLATAISTCQSPICALSRATGVAGMIGGEIFSVGEIPEPDFVRALALFLRGAMTTEDLYHTDNLPGVWELATSRKDLACGILAVRLPPRPDSNDVDNLIVWFRPEVISTVFWAGGCEKSVEVDETGTKIGPRKSFEKWKQLVQLHSNPWTEHDILAAQRFRSRYVHVSLEARENARIRAALKQAETLAALGQAISEVAHDLRSPLGQIESVVTMLREDMSMSQDEMELFDLIPRSLEDARVYMDDVLNFSKEIKLQKVGCDLKIFLDELVQKMKLLATDDRIEFTSAAPTGISASFDPVRLGRALTNLRNNAFDALASGNCTAPAVSITAEADDHVVRFSVADNGPGIPKDVLERLFEPFATSGKIGGTGLGLSIAKKMVVAHGGTINVRSSASGTVFLIEIPR